MCARDKYEHSVSFTQQEKHIKQLAVLAYESAEGPGDVVGCKALFVVLTLSLLAICQICVTRKHNIFACTSSDCSKIISKKILCKQFKTFSSPMHVRRMESRNVMSMFFFISFAIFIKVCLSTRLSCLRDDIKIHEVARDKKLNVAPYVTKTVSNENDCLVVCLYDDYCLSYNVNMTSKNVKCQLFSKIVGATKLTPRKGFKYFRVISYHRCIPVKNSSPKICDCRPVAKRDAKRDCLEWRENGAKEDGLYNINVGNKTVEVLCDMTTDGGGWTVIQKRQRSTNPVNFSTTWDEYKQGFGNFTTEFWLGNDYIHNLTTQGDITLRIHSTAENNMTKISILTHFRVADEKEFYQVTYKNSTGPSLDGWKSRFNRSIFSTFDSDKDNRDDRNCAAVFNAGFWFDRCSGTNLNGPYMPHDKDFGFFWRKWNKPTDEDTYQLKATTIMIRRNAKSN
ncbi:uncharacterized protein LOC130645966 [Hydractinia symbiolongicarpus]|uniref:uncharacterized protein LOC130645966 n=1 Tax=Hydractinia symbiolongicarpus TaxID=13093 RepID=UPI00254B4709|nr:uncharacterized protein LOC130645966 [Hydractinia symbiolongicarpus]